MLHSAWRLYMIFWHRNPGVAWPSHVIGLFCIIAVIHGLCEQPPRFDRRSRTSDDYWNRNHPEDDNGTT